MVSVFGQKPVRVVKDNVLISDKLPEIKIVLKGKFEYVGRFDFKIRDVAAGERFVFVDAKDGKVKRLFIAQFEGFLPGIDDFFRYNFANAETYGGHKFRQNTYAYGNREAKENNPQGEASLTFDFLKEKEYHEKDHRREYFADSCYSILCLHRSQKRRHDTHY